MSSITLILCTYNRCRSLAKALESVAASTLLDSVGWDVLVVDNNSTDQTREVIEDFCRRYPGRFHYMFVPQQGKSRALNDAIEQARGDVLAFTDDDVIVEPNWLRNLTAPLDEGKWSGTAGRISLGVDFSPPPWLPIRGAFNLGGSLVQFDEGDTQAELTKPPFGANMAFRKCMFGKYGNFRTDLGRNGRGLIGNEDTEFGLRLMAAGERMCYVPSAVVNHPAAPERLTKSYFRAYWFSFGRSLVRQAGKRHPLWVIPLRYLRQFKHRLQWMFSVNRRWFLSAHGRFFCEVQALLTVGQIVESYRQSFDVSSSRKPGDSHDS
jgi:glucosyl-dolichyl phosphate glucuronosyltransferase